MKKIKKDLIGYSVGAWGNVCCGLTNYSFI